MHIWSHTVLKGFALEEFLRERDWTLRMRAEPPCGENHAEGEDGMTVRAVVQIEDGGVGKDFLSRQKCVRAVSIGLVVCVSGSCSNATPDAH